jgi:hypothetical protein
MMIIKDYIDTLAPTPDWLKEIGDEAKRKGLNKITMRQIYAEIAATRQQRRQKQALTQWVSHWFDQ